MKCLDCARNGATTEAIGNCHHCSASVCDSHSTLVSDPVTVPGGSDGDAGSARKGAHALLQSLSGRPKATRCPGDQGGLDASRSGV